MIPPLSEIQQGSSDALSVALEVLFEHSPILITTLQPQLSDILKKSSLPLESYTQLINYAIAQIMTWDLSAQSQFISGHPRIGENKNLSNLSAKEQQQAIPTSPDVLARLGRLNVCYEIRYPGLRYITFVNGRARLEIAEEMENMLGLPHSLSPDNPPFETIYPVDFSSEEWKRELDRAVHDIGLIAKSRLGALGVI
jgi:2-oxo-4-hydroxy-4-carboxy--5-ureidoimidazoline (OHCU) decarboxylase